MDQSPDTGVVRDLELGHEKSEVLRFLLEPVPAAAAPAAAAGTLAWTLPV